MLSSQQNSSVFPWNYFENCWFSNSFPKTFLLPYSYTSKGAAIHKQEWSQQAQMSNYSPMSPNVRLVFILVLFVCSFLFLPGFQTQGLVYAKYMFFLRLNYIVGPWNLCFLISLCTLVFLDWSDIATNLCYGLKVDV